MPDEPMTLDDLMSYGAACAMVLLVIFCDPKDIFISLGELFFLVEMICGK